MYRKHTYTKTSIDGETETIETIEKTDSGLLEFCGAIAAITLSIIAATLILQGLKDASSFRRLDQPIDQSQKSM